MRMNDIEWELCQENRDKAITARSARNVRTHCGKSGRVRLPSDNLTKKEIKAMSGEVIQYASLKNPMPWLEFKKLADDLKVMYIKSIRDRFGAPDKYIAEMLGVSYQTLNLYLTDLKCTAGKKAGNGNKKWEKEKFYAWMSGADEKLVEGTAEVESEEIPADEVENECPDTNNSIEQIDIPGEGWETTVYPEPKYVPYGYEIPHGYNVVPVIPKNGSMSFENNRPDDILQTVRALLDGAGVRINCTITWEVVATSDSK